MQYFNFQLIVAAGLLRPFPALLFKFFFSLWTMKYQHASPSLRCQLGNMFCGCESQAQPLC